MPCYGALGPPPSLPERKTLLDDSLIGVEPEIQPSAYPIEGLDQAPTVFPTTKGKEEDLVSSPIDKDLAMHNYPIVTNPEVQTVKWHEDDLIAFSDEEDAKKVGT